MRRTGTTLPIARALSLLVTPLVAEALPTGKPVWLGLLYGGSPAFNPESDPLDRASDDDRA